MRINVYSQELTKEVTIVEKRAADTRETHYGVRIYLASPAVLHQTPDDDDRSAITFWLPNCGSYTPADLASVFDHMANLVDTVAPRVKENRRDG